MEGYKIGDIGALLNASSTIAPTNDLFAPKPTSEKVTVEEVYATAEPVVASKRPRKTKPNPSIVEGIEDHPDYRKLSPSVQLEVNKRTLFVGNLPISFKKKHLRKKFDEFGKIETIRFRSVAISDLKLGKKACLKSNKVNENASNKNAYIVFKDAECLGGALSQNNSVIDGHTLRVDKVVKSKDEAKDDTTNSIFIGNIAFTATEDQVRSALAQCGDIEYVRLLRDPKTNIGKGIGYVKFEDSSGVMLAMKIRDTVEVEGRKLRIEKCKAKTVLEAIKKSKSKTVQVKHPESTEQVGFRGRKSKKSDKELFVNKKKGGKKVDPSKRPGGKKNTMKQAKFDKKVNKVNKKSELPAPVKEKTKKRKKA